MSFVTPETAGGNLFDAEQVKGFVRGLHATEEILDTYALDQIILGMNVHDAERRMTDEWGWDDVHRFKDHVGKDEGLRGRFEGEEIWAGCGLGVWTDYDIARSVVKKLGLTENDTFYDLGSGYGRVVLWAAINSEATCKGIELASERAAITNNRAVTLELPNASVIDGNVREQDYADGDVFYMYLPFSSNTFSEVFDQLEKIADQKALRIVMKGGLLLAQMRGWLVQTDQINPADCRDEFNTIGIFMSV